MRKILFLLVVTLTSFLSCAQNEDAILEESSRETLVSSALRFAVDDWITPVYRSYYWGSQTQTDHKYSTEIPPVARYLEYYIGNLKYKHESSPFYVFAKTGGSNLDDKADLPLYKKYDSAKVDHYLYTLRSGVTDNNPGESRLLLGYIYSTWRPGLVPLREYYSEKEKDHFYISSEAQFASMGNESGNYKYVKMLGYVLPSTAYDANLKTGFVFKFDWSKLKHKMFLNLIVKVRDRSTNVYSTQSQTAEFIVNEPTEYKRIDFEFSEKYEVISADLQLYVYRNEAQSPTSPPNWTLNPKNIFNFKDLTNTSFPNSTISFPITGTNQYIKQSSISYNKNLYHIGLFLNPIQ